MGRAVVRTRSYPDPNRSLAQGRPATATGSQEVCTPGKAADGDANGYWGSTNDAFAQSWTVDLGSSRAVRRLVLKLPPSSARGTRTQTFTVLGSADGSGCSTVVGAPAPRLDRRRIAAMFISPCRAGAGAPGQEAVIATVAVLGAVADTVSGTAAAHLAYRRVSHGRHRTLPSRSVLLEHSLRDIPSVPAIRTPG